MCHLNPDMGTTIITISHLDKLLAWAPCYCVPSKSGPQVPHIHNFKICKSLLAKQTTSATTNQLKIDYVSAKTRYMFH